MHMCMGHRCRHGREAITNWEGKDGSFNNYGEGYKQDHCPSSFMKIISDELKTKHEKQEDLKTFRTKYMEMSL